MRKQIAHTPPLQLIDLFLTLIYLILQQCKQVLGIECVAQGIEDARHNAATNNIENCEFFCGRAEDVLGTLGDKISGSEVVAVVDPPRGGLRKYLYEPLLYLYSLS